MLPFRVLRRTIFSTQNTLRWIQRNNQQFIHQASQSPKPRNVGDPASSFRIIQRLRAPPKRFFSEKPPSPPKYDPTPNLNSPEPSLTLSQRMRKLSREYGWSAVGVYLLLTAIDFPFCFIAVRAIGTERIGEWEHYIVEWFKRAVPIQIPTKWRSAGEEKVEEVQVAVDGAIAGYDHGVKDAEKANTGETASIWTQLALAYAIHKSFIFIRVPITAAITPKVVKVLRGWGWNIGKRKGKAVTSSVASKPGVKD
ncbi:hypothetical protein MMC34_006711 [Xylographa carneopallida]|nr:hypothetical protein [Xylographa carneopallida]